MLHLMPFEDEPGPAGRVVVFLADLDASVVGESGASGASGAWASGAGTLGSRISGAGLSGARLSGAGPSGAALAGESLSAPEAASGGHPTAASPNVEAWALAYSFCLTSGERERAERFVRVATGRRWAAAHVIVRHIVGALVGCPPGDLHFGREEHGKPYLDHTDRLEFSLSHAGPFVLVALIPQDSADCRLGADVEMTMSVAAAREVARSLHPEESAAAGRLLDAEVARAVTRAWVRKEAYLKALGVGLLRDPALDVVGMGSEPSAPAADSAEGRLVDLPPLPGQTLPGQTLPRLAAHAAICLLPRAVGNRSPWDVERSRAPES